MESLGGKIRTIALNDISFTSEVGAIKLESSSVVMPSLPTAKTGPRMPLGGASSSSNGAGASTYEIFQLCVCESGKLFLASPHLVCASENDDRVCR